MKKVFIFTSLLVLAVILSSSCVFHVNGGNGKSVRCKGPVVTKTFDLNNFESIVLNGGCDINLIQQDKFLVSVEANEEVFEHLDYRVSGNSLILEAKDQVNIIADEYNVTIGLPVLTSVTVNGAGDVDLKNGYSFDEDLKIEVNGAGDLDFTGIQVPKLSISVNGAGDIDANDLTVKELKISVNGAGDAKVSGKADKASFSVAGVGGIDARELDCEDFQTSKSGIASIRTK
jgi:hypothetical protein